jgi:hypothetical protein
MIHVNMQQNDYMDAHELLDIKVNEGISTKKERIKMTYEQKEKFDFQPSIAVLHLAVGVPIAVHLLRPALFTTSLKWLVHLRGLDLGHELLPSTRKALWRPLRAVPGLASRVVVHRIDSLERQITRLVEERERDKGAQEVAPCEDVSVPEVNRGGDEGREERDEEVPEPVGSRGECSLLGTSTGGESLSNDNPNTGCPGCGIAKDKQASGNNHHYPKLVSRVRSWKDGCHVRLPMPGFS